MPTQTDTQEKAFISAARLAGERGLARFTRFLDPAQAQSAARIARESGVAFSCYGGYEQAERIMGCFCAPGEEPTPNEYPLVCLCSSYTSRFCTPTHRDLLGAFMSSGLTRDCIGDIIIGDQDVFLFATQQTSDFIAQSLQSAGKTPLHFRPQAEGIPMPRPKGTAFHDTVSSLRLDAVLAGAYRLSRADAAQLIKAGFVKVDHIPCERVDAQVLEGALLSLRGKGRVRLDHIDGLTRKQRIGLTFFRYE